VSISAIQVVDGEPTPLMNIDTSGNVPPIAHIETTPIASIERALINPNTIVTPPCDLSGLCSGTQNLWGSVCHCFGHYLQPHQFSHQRQHLPIYPYKYIFTYSSYPETTHFYFYSSFQNYSTPTQNWAYKTCHQGAHFNDFRYSCILFTAFEPCCCATCITCTSCITATLDMSCSHHSMSLWAAGPHFSHFTIT